MGRCGTIIVIIVVVVICQNKCHHHHHSIILVIIIIKIPFVVIINTLGLPKNFSVFAAPLLISLDLRTVRPEFKQMLQV